jgi:chemotaxis protein CheC
VRQAFSGDISGRALLIFPEKNSLELVRAVAGEGLSLEDILELEHEALAEIGNMILNACMATVANLLHRGLTMSLPEIVRGTGGGMFDLSVSMTDDVVLFAHINFSLKGRQIVGYVAMVMDFASLASLKELIAGFIHRMSGQDPVPRPSA